MYKTYTNKQEPSMLALKNIFKGRVGKYFYSAGQFKNKTLSRAGLLDKSLAGRLFI